MIAGPGCKGCSATVRVRPESVERILQDYLHEHPDSLVGDKEYQHRLNLCRACGDLEYETTCRHCGCLVDVRAKLADKHCPSPVVSAW